MKRRLILHLGLPKTGTSTVQEFFRRNRDKLSAAGIIFPRVDVAAADISDWKTPAGHPARLGGHQPLAVELRSVQRGADGRGGHLPLWSAVFQQIQQSDAHTVVISSEALGGKVESLDFGGLKERFAEFDVTGIVYLRSQESWVISYYGQKVRGEARTSTPISDFRLYRKSERLRYSEKLDMIVKMVPLDRIVVGNFDDAVRVGLLDDFLQLADLPRDLASGDETSKRRNAALPHWATLFLVRCNAARLPDAAFYAVRDALGVMVSNGRDPELRPGLDVASPTERRTLRELTILDAERLAEKYGVTFRAQATESTYRPFERQDFVSIRRALKSDVDQATFRALRRIDDGFAQP